MSHLHTPPPSDVAIQGARRNLDAFVIEQAQTTVQRSGLAWRASPHAPSTYNDLRREHRTCTFSRLPLRVSSLHCDRTIFVRRETNHAMRFWHDCMHVELDLSFEALDEMQLAAHHLDVLRAAGYGSNSVEHKLLHADTAGQTLCAAEIGRFPADQRSFAICAARSGVAAAIEQELHTEQLVLARPDGAA